MDDKQFVEHFKKRLIEETQMAAVEYVEDRIQDWHDFGIAWRVWPDKSSMQDRRVELLRLLGSEIAHKISQIESVKLLAEQEVDDG